MKHNITYDAALHRYYCNGRSLISVTTLLNEVKPPFDSDKIAARCARKEGKTKLQILAEWDAKGEASRQNGTDVHTYVERLITGKVDPVEDAMNYPHLEERKLKPEERKIANEYTAADKAWGAFRERLDAKLVMQETIVGDPELGIAGRVDLVLDVTPKVDGVTRRCLCDWKTGKMNTVGQWGNLLPPFDDCGDCELEKYSLQLSLYRLLLERETPKEPYGDSYLVHLRPNGSFQIHRANDYRERVLAWLKGRVQA